MLSKEIYFNIASIAVYFREFFPNIYLPFFWLSFNHAFFGQHLCLLPFPLLLHYLHRVIANS